MGLNMGISRLCKCGVVVKGQCGYCYNVRQTKTDDYRGTKAERGYGSDWDKFSRRYRLLHPLCECCLLDGRTTPAVDVHHIVKISVRPDLRMDEDNVMSVCRMCHKRLDSEAVPTTMGVAKRYNPPTGV